MTSINPVVYEIFDAVVTHPNTMVIRNGGDGCLLNSHVACEVMRERGVTPHEVIIEKRRPASDIWFSPYAAREDNVGSKLNAHWLKHIVPACKTDGTVVVFDPLLFETPALLPEYMAVFPKEVEYAMRNSSHITFAQRDMESEAGSAELVKRVSRGSQLANYAPTYEEPYRGAPEDFDGMRAGPTLGYFVQANLIGRRHKSAVLGLGA